MRFRHEVIDDSPPCGRLGICLPTDLTGNGRPDLIVGGLGSETLPLLGTGGLPLIGRLLRRLETSVFWYENPGWERHDLSAAHDLYVFGNTLADITGDGRTDLVVGQGIGSSDIYWFEQPADPREPWTRRLIDSAFEKYHDLAFGDIDGDGEAELVGTSQRSEVVFYYDVPEDPFRSPWPPECRHVIAENTNVEGLEIADVDGDGRDELIAGASIYRHVEGDRSREHGERLEADGGDTGPDPDREVADGWSRERVASGWGWTRVAVADLDGDGDLEIVFSEGDSPVHDGKPGRVGWFDPPDWEPHILRDDLFCPHTVAIADFDGSRRPDVYVAEMGLGEHDGEARHFVFRNRGGGEFRETVVERGIPTHEAEAVDLNGDGRVDLVGKSYEPNVHVDVWYNETPLGGDRGETS